MSDCTAARITLHIPKQGCPELDLKEVLTGLSLSSHDKARLSRIQKEGGHIALLDDQAREGWPFGIDLDRPDSALTLPPALEYDYYTAAKYEIPAHWRFRRAGKVRLHPSDHEEGIFLTASHICELQAAGKGLQDALDLLCKPPLSYPVPRRRFQIHID
jgi:hypothetical protein